jgi:phenylpyruvate tautomerase PptA (4-oxalocrotonate tautomerase family)
MPYLQLDLPHRYPIELKRRLAQNLGYLFADVMQTTPDKVNVGFRELTGGNLWRCGLGGPTPSAVLICDIRRGRPPEQRARLAEALVAACSEALALPPKCMIVHFTQHAGDEIFVPGRGLVHDWTPAEAKTFALGGGSPSTK